MSQGPASTHAPHVLPQVLVAMSGGVDSAVAAAFLKQAGYPLLGVTMKLWDYAEVGGDPLDRDGRCCSLETMGGARNTAEILGIPFYVMDMTGPFRRTVIDNFISEYRAGRTPNPCVVCNNKIKWSALYDRARQVGAERIATGHYARVRQNENTGRWELLKGKDASRDQSYVLYGLTQEQLAATLFPLGDLLKSDVREHARTLGLPVANAPESREICFITDDNYRRFLREQLASDDPARSPGALLDERGTQVGVHDGYSDFTVGQRRGLGVTLGRPYYVSKIDAHTKTVHLAPEADLYQSSTMVKDVNWVSMAPPDSPARARVKIRYLHQGEEAVLTPVDEHTWEVAFETPQRALTPGQSAVFYDGDRVLGGGIVAPPAR